MPGKFTCTSWSRRGATTMKMMSRTRTTSTSGVTFISGLMSPRRRLRDAVTTDPGRLGLAPALDGVGELARGGRERALVRGDRAREVVEREHGRDRDREP